RSAAASVAFGAAACTTNAPAAQGGTERPGGQSGGDAAADLPASIRALKPLPGSFTPITDDERRARLEKARRLMAENKIDAIVLEGGSSLYYFTGVRWGLSERPFVGVIPAKGDLAWVCPGFEEARARELIRLGGSDVRTWQEDESPYARV